MPTQTENETSVTFLDPTGQARLIPASQADAAEKAGGKRVVKMLDPKGQRRWIPLDQKDAAIRAGGKLVASGDWFADNAPNAAPSNGDWFADNAPGRGNPWAVVSVTPATHGAHSHGTDPWRVVSVTPADPYAALPDASAPQYDVSPPEHAAQQYDVSPPDASDPFAAMGEPDAPQPPQGLYNRAKAQFLSATAPNHPGPDTRTAADFGLPANASAEDLRKMRGVNPQRDTVAELLKGSARGAATLVRHPLETLRATAQTIFDLANAPLPIPGAINHPTDSQRASMRRVDDQVDDMVSGFKEDPAYAAGEMIGPAMVTEGAGEVVKLPVKGVAELKRMAAEKFGPRVVPIAGEKVPVLAGEAAPETAVGRTQATLKRAGVGAAKFDRVSRLQQEAVKKVIRNVAQRTSGLTGPMTAEPGVAMADAADATFAQARPMYQALDSSLVEVPDSLANASRVTANAIERARKLGVEVNTAPEGGAVTINGRTFTPGGDPVAWENLKAQGLTPATTGGQPLSTYIKIRSELLKIQRGAVDAALRSKIGDEVRAMNGQMDEALKGSPLHENWTEANRLWSKGYALRDVADAITKTTKGTPAAEQAAGISPVQTRVQGPALVRKLNELERNGTLGRAFTPDEAGNLRQSIDLLDRASASAGKAGGLPHGYSPRSVIWRTIMGLPSIPLVNAMTRTDGLAALQAAERASSQQAAIAAMAHLASIAAAASTPKTAGEAKQQVRAMQARP